MVEFALVSLILVLLVTGIINFGLILSLKQDITRAAAEGARAGAVALPPAAPPASQTLDSRYMAALAATEEAVDGFGKGCGTEMACEVVLHDCDTTPAKPFNLADVAYYGTPTADCVTVDLEYDYAGHPIIAKPPLLASALPEQIPASSVARLNK
jgi:Flp pilus assembly protein TadG